MKKRITPRVNVRLLPRVKHIHKLNTIVGVRGRRVRYGCETCPAIDPYWYPPVASAIRSITADAVTLVAGVKRLSDGAAPFKKSLDGFGWVSGSSGSTKEPLRGDGGFVVLADSYDERGTRVISDTKLLHLSVDPGGTAGVVAKDKDDPLPAEPKFTDDKLMKLDKKQLQTICVTLDKKFNTKTTKPELIAAILSVYEEDSK